MKKIVGVFNGEGPPVPIPNTEVKLTSAENTCLATDWEDRSMPTQKTRVLMNSGFFLFKYNTVITKTKVEKFPSISVSVCNHLQC